ncbi:MAG: glycosyltransferase [Methanomassiliicoccales archaeon]
MESKRIIMTSTFFPPFHLGGDATHVKMLRDELERRGHEVHIIYSLDAYRLKRGKVSGDIPSSPTIHPIEGRLRGVSAFATYLTGRNHRAESSLERLVAEIRPDWIHHHNISLLGAGVLYRSRFPSVYTAHDYWLICPRSDLMFKGKETCQIRKCSRCNVATGRPPQIWRPFLMPKALGSLRLIISPSHFLASRLQHFLGLEATVLPNFAPRPPSNNWPEGEHFCFVGVLEKGKGLHLLLKAFEDESLGSLHIMGKGSLEEEVRRMERLTGGRICYKGFLTGDELWQEMGSSRALICPSTGNENSPLACIEALSLGVPLIVTRRGGLPELVESPKCGESCEPEPRSIAEAVRVISDPSKRSELRKNAFMRYQRYHEPSSYIKRYLELCEMMMNGSEKSGPSEHGL